MNISTKQVVYNITLFFCCFIGISVYANKVIPPPVPAPSNDEWANAIELFPANICSYQVFDNVGATHNAGNPAIPYICANSFSDIYYDVWFKFKVPASGHVIINSKEGLKTDTKDPMNNGQMAIYSENGGNLTYITCEGDGGDGDNSMPKIENNLLPIGQYIYIRFWHANYGGGVEGTFEICVKEIPPPVTNDECINPIIIPTPTTTCSYTTYGNYGATTTTGQTASGCGVTNKDVWFKTTVPTSGLVVINSLPLESPDDGAMTIYSGTCGALTYISCSKDDGNEQMPFINQKGLSPGSDLWIRYWSETNKEFTFNLCVMDGTPPANDEACGAQDIDLRVGFCASIDTNNYTATPSTETSPVNPDCGKFTNQTSRDLWYKLIVPPSGKVNLSLINKDYHSAMQLFTGPSCSNITELKCIQTTSGIETATLFEKDLVVGSTLWIRVWGYYDKLSKFSLCVTEIPVKPDCAVNPPPADEFKDATLICDLQGYCGNTSAKDYSIDIPHDLEAMFCNTENTLDNNSWLKFVAADPKVYLNVFTYGCTGSTIPELNGAIQGIQAQILEFDEVNKHFIQKSNCFNPCTEADGGVAALDLTIGKTYYLMIDGNAKDVCDYTISAVTGVSTGGTPPMEDKKICKGSSVKLEVPGGKDDYYWTSNPDDPTLVDPDEDSPTVTPTITTTYTVRGLIGPCVTTPTEDIIVYVANPPVVSLSGGSTICSGEKATLTATFSDGIAPWSITYSDGINPPVTIDDITTTLNTPYTFDVTPTNTGASSITLTYQIATVESGGCNGTFSGSADVIVKPAPLAPAVTSPVTYCQDFSGATALSATGVAGATFDWYADATTTTKITPLPIIPSTTTAGTTSYYVSQTLNGCESTRAVIDVKINPTPTVNFPNPNSSIICEKGSYDIPLIITSTGDVEIIYNDGTADITTTISKNAATPVISVTPTATGPTVYTLKSVTDKTTSCPNTLSDNFTVNVTPTPAAEIQAPGTSTICRGLSGNFTVDLTTGSAPWDFTWNNGTKDSTVNVATGNSFTVTVSPSVTTTYTLKSINANNCAGTPSANTAVITVKDVPTAALYGSNSICQGAGGATFMARLTGSSHDWDLTYSDETNAPNTPITEHIVDATWAIPYFDYTLNVTPTNTTTYRLISINDHDLVNGCPGIITIHQDSSSATITLVDLPTVTMSSNPICAGSQATITFTIGGGDAPWTIKYDTGTVAQQPLVVQSTQYNDTYVLNPTLNKSTIYTIREIKNHTECIGALPTPPEHTVIVNPIPDVDFKLSKTSECAGIGISVSLGTPTTTGNYSWSSTPTGVTFSNGNGIGTPYDTQTIDATAGIYDVTLSVTDNNCPATATKPVTFKAIPSAFIGGKAKVCEGEDSQISFHTTGTTPWTIGYTADGVATSYSVRDSGELITVTPVIPQSEYIITSVTDQTGCIGTIASPSSFTVTVSKTPTLSIDPVAGDCPPFSALISIQSDGINFSWEFNDPASEFNTETGSGKTVAHTYSYSGSYSPTVVAYNQDGCSNSETLSPPIVVPELPEAIFTYTPQKIGTILENEYQFYDASITATKWDWNFHDTLSHAGISNEQNPTHAFSDTGKYVVNLIVKNEFGCSDTTYATILIKEDYAIYIPNAFTPNNDGLNEIFKPEGIGIDKDNYTMYIFDRWGGNIFTSTDPEVGWDGKVYGGALAPIGIYQYVIKTKTILSRRDYEFSGSVHLISRKRE